MSFKDNIQAFDRAKQKTFWIPSFSKHRTKDSPEYEKEMNKWEETNKRTVIDKSFMKIDKWCQKINDILSVLNTEEDNSDFADIWKEILNITYGHRDEDNQPIGTEITGKSYRENKVSQRKIRSY